MEKVTAGHDALGEFAPKFVTMYYSVRYGQERISFHLVTVA